MVGVLIGLAAATKWVGWYALIGLWVLVLARSPLGTLVLVAGIGFLTIMARLSAWPFLVVCALALLLALVLVSTTIRLAMDDLGDAGDRRGRGRHRPSLHDGLLLGAGADAAAARSVRLFAFLARGAQAAWPAGSCSRWPGC